jgi:hypothetical protein
VFLVDTNVISEPTRRAPAREVLSWLVAHPVVALSVVSLAELEAGVRAAAPTKRARLAEWLERLLSSGAIEVVAVDEAVARAAGRLMAERRKRPLPFADVLIAATALARGYVLATRNVRHFDGLGLSVVDPWNG